MRAGAGGMRVRIHAVGAVAMDLVTMYAERQTLDRDPCPPDDERMDAFDAGWEHTPTPDQEKTCARERAGCAFGSADHVSTVVASLVPRGGVVFEETVSAYSVLAVWSSRRHVPRIVVLSFRSIFAPIPCSSLHSASLFLVPVVGQVRGDRLGHDGAPAAHGPAGARRRGLREDGGGHARDVPRRLRRPPGTAAAPDRILLRHRLHLTALSTPESSLQTHHRKHWTTPQTPRPLDGITTAPSERRRPLPERWRCWRPRRCSRRSTSAASRRACRRTCASSSSRPRAG